jgi:hypothetical protein
MRGVIKRPFNSKKKERKKYKYKKSEFKDLIRTNFIIIGTGLIDNSLFKNHNNQTKVYQNNYVFPM